MTKPAKKKSTKPKSNGESELSGKEFDKLVGALLRVPPKHQPIKKRKK